MRYGSDTNRGLLVEARSILRVQSRASSSLCFAPGEEVIHELFYQIEAFCSDVSVATSLRWPTRGMHELSTNNQAFLFCVEISVPIGCLAVSI